MLSSSNNTITGEASRKNIFDAKEVMENDEGGNNNRFGSNHHDSHQSHDAPKEHDKQASCIRNYDASTKEESSSQDSAAKHYTNSDRSRSSSRRRATTSRKQVPTTDDHDQENTLEQSKKASVARMDENDSRKKSLSSKYTKRRAKDVDRLANNVESSTEKETTFLGANQGQRQSSRKSVDSSVVRKKSARFRSVEVAEDLVEPSQAPASLAKASTDDEVNSKMRVATAAFDQPMEPPKPGTATAIPASGNDRISRKKSSVSRGMSTMDPQRGCSISAANTKLYKKIQESSRQSDRKLTALTIDEPTEPCEPGTATATVARRDNRVERKLAANSSRPNAVSIDKDDAVGVVRVAMEDPRMSRKLGRAQSRPGAVSTQGDDPATSKNRWVEDDVFHGDDGQVDPELYYVRKEQERQEHDDKKKASVVAFEEAQTKGQLAEIEVVPSLPGAYRVGGAASWLVRGMSSRRKKKAKSMKSLRMKSGLNDLDVDTGIQNGVDMDEEIELTWWEAIDKTVLGVGFCILLVVLVAVLVPTVLAATKGSSPTPAPNSMRVPLYEDFQEVFIEVSGREAFDDATSPQSRSLDFIVLEDPLQLTLESPTLTQRYILMVIFYANGGEQWPFKSTKWGSEAYECQWDYIRCGGTDEGDLVTAIELFRVGMTGDLPSEIQYFHNLEQLDIAENKLNPSPIPTFLYSMTNLSLLYLEANRFTGTLSEAIGQLSNLAFLGLADTDLSGSLPASMTSLSNMRNFLAYRTGLSGPLLQIATDGWPNIENIDAVQAGFYGTFSTSIGKLTSLRNILMSDNDIEGPLPTEIGELFDISRFTLSRNANIRGPLPSEIGNWLGLQELTLASTQLSGAIPEEVGYLEDLIRLDLSQNSLSGTIPSKLGLCTSLTELSLTLNDITGTIPTELGNLAQLKSMTLHRNDITGSMPDSVCELRTLQLRELVVDCLGTFPEVVCPFPDCCSQCS